MMPLDPMIGSHSDGSPAEEIHTILGYQDDWYERGLNGVVAWPFHQVPLSAHSDSQSLPLNFSIFLEAILYPAWLIGIGVLGPPGLTLATACQNVQWGSYVFAQSCMELFDPCNWHWACSSACWDRPRAWQAIGPDPGQKEPCLRCQRMSSKMPYNKKHIDTWMDVNSVLSAGISSAQAELK